MSKNDAFPIKKRVICEINLKYIYTIKSFEINQTIKSEHIRQHNTLLFFSRVIKYATDKNSPLGKYDKLFNNNVTNGVLYLSRNSELDFCKTLTFWECINHDQGVVLF